MAKRSGKPAAVDMAHEISENGNIVVERWGVRAELIPVPIGVLDEAESRIDMPPVPIVTNEAEGTEFENPSDPHYLDAIEKAKRQRGIAAIEAMSLFGVNLLDGLPQTDDWLKKLKFYEKRGHMDLSWVDWNDDTEVEFVFVRYAFLTMDDVTQLGLMSRLTQEELQRAADSFRGQ